MHLYTYAVDPATTSDGNDLTFILLGVLLPTVSIIVIAILFGATAARCYYKKVCVISDHVYDLPNFIELPPLPPPLPPPRPTLAENGSISEPNPKYGSASEPSASRAELSSLHNVQQPSDWPPRISAATGNFPGVKINSENIVNGTDIESNCPHLKSICSCHEKDSSLEFSADIYFVTPTIEMQENDAYGLVLSDKQGSQEVPQPCAPLSLSLTSNVHHHDSELNSNYEQICGYERIQTCDTEIEHLILQCKGTQDHNTPTHSHGVIQNESPVTVCKQQSLSGYETQSPAESSSYEQIWGYEKVLHCDLHLHGKPVTST